MVTLKADTEISQDQHDGLAHLRARISACADANGIVLEETVKWGQPSFKALNGTPVRIGTPKSGGFGLFVSCSSTVIADYAATFEGRFDGNRGVLFESVAEAESQPLEMLLMRAFRYHEKP